MKQFLSCSNKLSLVTNFVLVTLLLVAMPAQARPHLAEAPTDIVLNDDSVPENSSLVTLVGLLSAVDPDNSSPYTYTLVEGEGDTGNSFFTISDNQLLAQVPFDFETKKSYSIRVRVTDNDGLFFEKILTVNVADVNEPPTGLTLSSAEVAENQPIGTTIGRLRTVDPDTNDSYVYTLYIGPGDTHNDLFILQGDIVKTNAIFNFEEQSSYSFRVQVTDSGKQTYQQAFVVTVTDENDAPTDIALTNNRVNEDTPAGAIVGYLSTTDPDATDEFSYSLVGGTGSDNNGSFNIEDNILKTKAVLDYETQTTYSIRVQTSDKGRQTFEKSFTIALNDVIERPPTDITLSNHTVKENLPSRTTVGSFSTTDPSSNEIHTYRLVRGVGDDDNGSFRLSDSVLQTNAQFDYEAKSLYQIRVETTDISGLTFEKQVTIQILDVFELPPTDIILSSNVITENLPRRTDIGTLTAVDPTAGDEHTYKLVSGPGDADNGAFTLSGNILRSNQVFDYETKNSYSIRVQTADIGGLTFEKVFIINILNDTTETPPTDILLSRDKVAENQPSGFEVGRFTTVDAGLNESHSYRLVSGLGSDNNGSFSISGNLLKTRAVFSTAVKITYTIRVQTTDDIGLTFEKPFTITVIQAQPPISIALSNQLVFALQPTGTVVGQFSTIDPDENDQHTYSLVSGEGSTDNDSFMIEGGILKTKAVFSPTTSPDESLFYIRVRTTDQGGLSYEQPFTLTLTSNLTPTDIILSNDTILEKQPSGTVVGTLTTVDATPNDSHTYALILGGDNPDEAFFTIEGDTLKTSAVFDAAVKTTYTLRVQTTDRGGLSYIKTLTISVTNINEAPTDILLSRPTVAENEPIGTVIGILRTTDPDAQDRFTYTLVAGPGDADNAAFVLDDYILQTNVVFDYETQISQTFRVQTMDAGGLTFSKALTVTITDVADTPTMTATVTPTPTETVTPTPQPTETPTPNENVILPTGGRATSADDTVALEFPAGAVTNPTTITLTISHTLPGDRPRPTETVFAGHAMEIVARDTTGEVTAFNVTATLTLTYTDNLWQEANLLEETLRVYWWAGQQWLLVCSEPDCPPDMAHNRFIIPLPHLTEFAIFGRQDTGITHRVYLPIVLKP